MNSIGIDLEGTYVKLGILKSGNRGCAEAMASTRGLQKFLRNKPEFRAADPGNHASFWGSLYLLDKLHNGKRNNKVLESRQIQI